MNNPDLIEKQSSAITLSDMEIFIFPELMFCLVLANMMSPRIWQWREDPWFDGIDQMKPYRRITRLKQFIMDHYDFNLDLDTWGLTNAETELSRFEAFVDRDTLSQSNALFGYEGDKYYFDIDIRTHFGLDKYDGNTIPYWKTETVEAMDAFKYREGYQAGAGECVSLAALYAAALFIIARIPIEDIFLMATPLHSQNFVMVRDGILTNNRRLVTKNMWFNGTALSAQARRALENERVTVVSHASGTIHTLYEEASIVPAEYERFSKALSDFLKTPLTEEMLGNFLRQEADSQHCFQLKYERNGREFWLPLEKAFTNENGSPYRVTDNTRDKLLADIDIEQFEINRLPKRIVLNDLEDFIKAENINIDNIDDIAALEKRFDCDCLDASISLKKLIQFCHTQPKLPDASEKQFNNPDTPLDIPTDIDRPALIAKLESLRATNRMADLAFFAYRDLSRIDPRPFLRACLERNPVCIEGSHDMTTDEMMNQLNKMPNESIYDEDGRLAQPDELWNYGRGDGIEKAITLANILYHREAQPLSLTLHENTVTLETAGQTYTFNSEKHLDNAVWHYPFA